MTTSSMGRLSRRPPSIPCKDTSSIEFLPAFWAALDATYYAGGQHDHRRREEPGPQPANVRLGLTAALSLSRHQSIKLYGSTGVYQPHRQRLLGGRDRLAIPLGWRPVARTPSSSSSNASLVHAVVEAMDCRIILGSDASRRSSEQCHRVPWLGQIWRHAGAKRGRSTAYHPEAPSRRRLVSLLGWVLLILLGCLWSGIRSQ